MVGRGPHTLGALRRIGREPRARLRDRGALLPPGWGALATAVSDLAGEDGPRRGLQGTPAPVPGCRLPHQTPEYGQLGLPPRPNARREAADGLDRARRGSRRDPLAQQRHEPRQTNAPGAAEPAPREPLPQESFKERAGRRGHAGLGPSEDTGTATPFAAGVLCPRLAMPVALDPSCSTGGTGFSRHPHPLLGLLPAQVCSGPRVAGIFREQYLNSTTALRAIHK